MKTLSAQYETIHRSHEYNESGFQTLLTMQKDHFWYRGRHRFLLECVILWCKRQLHDQSVEPIDTLKLLLNLQIDFL